LHLFVFGRQIWCRIPAASLTIVAQYTMNSQTPWKKDAFVFGLREYTNKINIFYFPLFFFYLLLQLAREIKAFVNKKIHRNKSSCHSARHTNCKNTTTGRQRIECEDARTL